MARDKFNFTFPHVEDEAEAILTETPILLPVPDSKQHYADHGTVELAPATLEDFKSNPFYLEDGIWSVEYEVVLADFDIYQPLPRYLKPNHANSKIVPGS